MESKRTAPSRPPNPAMPYREDCWSEGETSVLIDAWGDRYLDLNRGHLRQNQWQEVADSVNSRPCDARRPPRTDIQCKYRVDTLKKKYKAERSKISLSSAGSSQWKFYNRLDELIGASVSASANMKRLPQPQPLPLPPMALPLPAHRKGIPLPTAEVVEDSSSRLFRRRFEAAEEEEEEVRSRKKARRPVKEEVEEEEGDGIRELSKAIMRLGELYEKVEMEKQRQMMELEKQRIEFAKTMEVQRMQMFVDSQVQIMKMERERGRDERGEDTTSSSSALIPFLLQPVML